MRSRLTTRLALPSWRELPCTDGEVRPLSWLEVYLRQASIDVIGVAIVVSPRRSCVVDLDLSKDVTDGIGLEVPGRRTPTVVTIATPLVPSASEPGCSGHVHSVGRRAGARYASAKQTRLPRPCCSGRRQAQGSTGRGQR
jgi:hypothetical protein